MNVVTTIAGPIASGKSTLALELERRWSCPRAAFGRLVVHQATVRGEPNNRDALQALGKALIDELGWPEFCQRTIKLAGADWSTAPLIIDGVRHRAALDTLREHMAAPVSLLYVNCDLAIREQRQRARGAAPEEVRRWQGDPTELEVPGLAAIADVVVSGERPVALAVAEVERVVRAAS